MSAPSRIPPQDIDAEEVVLCSCLLSPESLGLALELVAPEVFYRDAHVEIFRLMSDLFAAGEPVDLVTVTGRLNDNGRLEAVGGAAYIASLTSNISTKSRIRSYCRRLRDKFILRKLISHCTAVIDRAYSNQPAADVSDFAETGMFDVVAEHSSGARGIAEFVDESVKLIEQRCSQESGVIGISTGFRDLDGKIAGLQGGKLFILAARPAMGKTALAMNIVQNTALSGNVPSVVYSLEMSGQELAERMLSGCSVVDGQSLRLGRVTEGDWSKIHRAADQLRAAPVFIDDSSGLSVVDIRARTRRLKSRFGVGLVVVDYLQLLRGTGRGEREQQVSEMSRGLKSLARELDIPVLALCQLNRGVESRTDKRPIPSDLRESGGLEQDADAIMFIYRDEVYHPGRNNENLAELIIGKQRSGPVGKIDMVFQKNISTFKDAYHAG